jgi:hypothetical protein
MKAKPRWGRKKSYDTDSVGTLRMSSSESQRRKELYEFGLFRVDATSQNRIREAAIRDSLLHRGHNLSLLQSASTLKSLVPSEDQ